jgi:hypothetical protein
MAADYTVSRRQAQQFHAFLSISGKNYLYYKRVRFKLPKSALYSAYDTLFSCLHSMLKLPLKYYDEAGRILPPVWLYGLLTFFCLDWIAFVFSLASRTQTETLLRIFYPHSESLGLALASSFPLVLVMILISQRERLWKHHYVMWSGWLIPAMVFGVTCSLGVQVYHAVKLHWNFDIVTAIKITVSLVGLYVLCRSRHLRWMIEDWQTPIDNDKDKMSAIE